MDTLDIKELRISDFLRQIADIIDTSEVKTI